MQVVCSPVLRNMKCIFFFLHYSFGFNMLQCSFNVISTQHWLRQFHTLQNIQYDGLFESFCPYNFGSLCLSLLHSLLCPTWNWTSFQTVRWSIRFLVCTIYLLERMLLYFCLWSSLPRVVIFLSKQARKCFIVNSPGDIYVSEPSHNV